MCAKKDTGKDAKKGGKQADKPKEKPRSKAPKIVENEDPDFVHLVRVSGVVVDGNLTIPKALVNIKGIGPRLADSVINTLEIPKETKAGALDEAQVAAIEKKLEEIREIVPAWMLNRRRDVETGENLHRIGPDLDMQLREDINREKKTKSYRGIRHAINLPVRGQRTRSTFRKGSTVGVSRKKK